MANLDATARCIRQAFDAGMQTRLPALKRFYEGQPVTSAEVNNDAFCRLDIIFGDANQVGAGGLSGRRVRTIGVAMVGIWTPRGEGYGEVYRIADTIADIWQVSTIQGIIYRASSLVPAGEEGSWVQHNVSTPFQADEIVTA